MTNPDLPKCALCKVNDPDQTGSHMVPFFLMRRVDGEGGSKERGKELGFKITASDVEFYHGQSVLPEKIEELIGDRTDDEIEAAKEDARSEVIVDNILCSDCEKRFGALESHYAQSFSKFDSKDYKSKVKSHLALLFWFGILWRMSVVKLDKVSLKSNEQERLRMILHKYMNPDLPQIKPEPNDSLLNSISYKIGRCPDYSNEHDTVMVGSPVHRRPYCLLLDEFCIYFYMKRSHENSVEQSFFGTEKLMKEAPMNDTFNGEQIKYITPEELEDIIKSAFIVSKGNILKFVSRKLDEIHHLLTNRKEPMPYALKAEVERRLKESDIEEGRKYSLKEIYTHTLAVLKRFTND